MDQNDYRQILSESLPYERVFGFETRRLIWDKMRKPFKSHSTEVVVKEIGDHLTAVLAVSMPVGKVRRGATTVCGMHIEKEPPTRKNSPRDYDLPVMHLQVADDLRQCLYDCGGPVLSAREGPARGAVSGAPGRRSLAQRPGRHSCESENLDRIRFRPV